MLFPAMCRPGPQTFSTPARSSRPVPRMYSSMPRSSNDAWCSDDVRAAGDRQAVVLGVAAQEIHHLAHVRREQGVGELEVEVTVVPGDERLGLRRVDHHVGELDRDRLALRDLPVRPAARRRRRPRWCGPRGRRTGSRSRRRGSAACRASLTSVTPSRPSFSARASTSAAVSAPNAMRSTRFSASAAQPHLVLLGRALGGEERDAGVGGLGRELPRGRCRSRAAGRSRARRGRRAGGG